VRAGSEDEFLQKCLSTGISAISWREIRGKIAIQGVEQDDLYLKLKEFYPSESNHTVGAYASQIYAFVNKIFGGDFILVPSGKGDKVSVGYLLGDVVENPPAEIGLLAARKVAWLTKEENRKEFFNLVKNTSAFENPRTVVETAISHQDIRKYVEKKTGKNFWELLASFEVNSWVFQFDPLRWSLSEALKKNVNDEFAANQNREKMKLGDVIFFRQSGSDSGVYAVGHLMRGPVHREDNEFGEWGVKVSFDYKIEEPLLKNEIKSNKDFVNITQINGLQGTNFSISNETATTMLTYLDSRLKVIQSKTTSEISYWWCNVGVTNKEAIATGTLWAHAESKDGSVLTHHTDMKKVRKGDVIFLYADKKVVALGSCTEESVDSTRPKEYPPNISSAEDRSDVPGFVVRAEFEVLKSPVGLEEVVDDLFTLVDKKGPLALNKSIKQGYLFPLSKEFGEKFIGRSDEVLPKDRGKKVVGPLDDYLTKLAEELLVTREWLSEVLGRIKKSRQVIFYGPPGTGKTFIGKAIARYIAAKEDCELIQFHPSYSYEDFFEGFRPAENSAGSVSLEKVPGPLRKIAARAIANPDKEYVLIIDEINRGNLAKIFGELYFLLEYRDEAISLMYSKDEKFSLPKNLIFIGTMNTADRSIALVDSALRRRFDFIHLDPTSEPCSEILPRWLNKNGLPNAAADLLVNLNNRLKDHDYSVGPAYFMKDEDHSKESLKLTWKYKIEPLLEEHFYGEWRDKSDEFSFEKMYK